jgi:uncharacterized protein YyaL (SSP411 family)
VDERWFVPHFEKMLYDQAQLTVSYLEAFQITGEPEYAETARRTMDYVLRDMTDRDGGFYSAEDADSVINPDEPNVKGEGAFYIWSAEEIRELLGEPTAHWLSHRYGVAEGGNVANDPHQEFTNRNILYEAATVAETAQQFGRPAEEVREAIERAERTLLEARAKRVRPHLDDKVLTGWNGLMISALAFGGAVLGEARYAEAARRAAEFILTRMYDPETGILLRRYRAGDAAIPGFLDDYALFTQALLDLYETQGDRRHLDFAVKLTEKQSELFEDRQQGGFYSSAADDTSLVMRVKEDHDGAEPSGNSVALMNLLRLAQMTGRSDFRVSAEHTLSAFARRLSAGPVAMPYMLAACEFRMGETRQIILVGNRDAEDTNALVRTVYSRFVPNKIVLLVDSPETRAYVARGIPAVEPMQMVNDRAAAYVCRNYTCQLPVSEPRELAELIQ